MEKILDKKYVFPDYDPDAQLRAISDIVRSITVVSEGKEKTILETKYSELNHEYVGDLYADDLCDSMFFDVAVSHAVIALIAPFVEGAFCHEIVALEENGYIGSGNYLRNKTNYFWELGCWVDTDGKKRKSIGIGIYQIIEALGVLGYFPDNFEDMLVLIFEYRNYALHNGFEAGKKRAADFLNKIGSKGMKKYFFWTTSGGKPLMVGMKKETINQCFTFCVKIKESFDKIKEIGLKNMVEN